MNIKKYRERQIAKKNFLPTLFLTFMCWGGLLYTVFNLDPVYASYVAVLLSLFFLTMFLTFSVLLINTRRGLIISLLLTIFLILRYYGFGTVINFIFLCGLAIVAEIYFTTSS